MSGPHYCIGDCQRAEAEILRLREALDESNYRADHYKREACLLADTDRTNLMQERFELTAEEAIVLAALYQRREKWLPGSILESLLDEHRGGNIEASLVSQMISKVRRKFAIENARGRGYRIAADALRQIDRKLSRGFPTGATQCRTK